MSNTVLLALGTAMSNKPTDTTVKVGGGIGLGALIGLVGGVDHPMLTLKWVQAWMGVGGFILAWVVAILLLIGYFMANYFISQQEANEERWNTRFEALRKDTKEAFHGNAAAMDRVTTMLERAAGMRTPSVNSSTAPDA